jgi:hypothetical protein
MKDSEASRSFRVEYHLIASHVPASASRRVHSHAHPPSSRVRLSGGSAVYLVFKIRWFVSCLASIATVLMLSYRPHKVLTSHSMPSYHTIGSGGLS